MAQRTVATPNAAQAARQMQVLVTTSLPQEAQQIIALGRQLCDPNQWDGTAAFTFRQQRWPQAEASMRQTLATLNTLHGHVQVVVADIMRAGGQHVSSGGANPLLLAPAAASVLRGVTGAAWWAAGPSWWRNANTLDDHFGRHGGDFSFWRRYPTRARGPGGEPIGLTTQGQYTSDAAAFLRDAYAKGYQIRVDPRGNIRVFDPQTGDFAAYDSTGQVRTFFRVDQAHMPGYINSFDPSVPNTNYGTIPSGADATALENLARDVGTSPWTRVMQSPVMRFVRAGGTALAVVGDVATAINPSPNALGGANLERGMAIANLGAIALTAAPVAELLAANAALDWVPGVGEVVMAGTALYLAGDFVYQNWDTISHWAGDAGHAIASVSGDVAHGVSSAWHSVTSWL